MKMDCASQASIMASHKKRGIGEYGKPYGGKPP